MGNYLARPSIVTIPEFLVETGMDKVPVDPMKYVPIRRDSYGILPASSIRMIYGTLPRAFIHTGERSILLPTPLPDRIYNCIWDGGVQMPKDDTAYLIMGDIIAMTYKGTILVATKQAFSDNLHIGESSTMVMDMPVPSEMTHTIYKWL